MMPRVVTGPALVQRSFDPALMERPVPLPAVSSLKKPQRPKSKSLQPCRCPEEGCGKMFSKRSNLKAHMRVHSGVLPYPCQFPGCDKRFRWKSSLKPHIKVHLASGDSLTPSASETSLHTKVPLKANSKVESKAEARNIANDKEEPIGCMPAPGSMPLKLPLPSSFEIPYKAEDNSPSAVMASSFSPTQVEQDPMDNIRPYACTFEGCGQVFQRLSNLIEHEEEEKHHRDNFAVSRLLFDDSTQENGYTEQGEIDLSCNSVLSGSQDSLDTDVVSFTLGSPQDSQAVDAKEVGQELWDNSLHVMDPFLDFSASYDNGCPDMEILSVCNSDVSNSNEEQLDLPDSQWLMQSSSSSLSNAGLPTSMYIT